MLRTATLALAAQLLAAAVLVSGQAATVVVPPAFGASAGTANASTSNVDQINEALGGVAAVEAGQSTAPLPVQQAFLASVKNDSSDIEGLQTVSDVPCPQNMCIYASIMPSLHTTGDQRHRCRTLHSPTNMQLRIGVGALRLGSVASRGRQRTAGTAALCQPPLRPSWSLTVRPPSVHNG